MATAIIILSMLLFLVVAVSMNKRGWIDLPDDPNELKLLSLGGGVVLIFLTFFVYTIGSDVLDQGLLPVLSCWGPFILIGMFGLLAGLAFFTRRKKKRSVVQQLDLDDRE